MLSRILYWNPHRYNVEGEAAFIIKQKKKRSPKKQFTYKKLVIIRHPNWATAGSYSQSMFFLFCTSTEAVPPAWVACLSIHPSMDPSIYPSMHPSTQQQLLNIFLVPGFGLGRYTLEISQMPFLPGSKYLPDSFSPSPTKVKLLRLFFAHSQHFVNCLSEHGAESCCFICWCLCLLSQEES